MVSLLRKSRAPFMLLVVLSAALSLDPLKGQAEEACHVAYTTASVKVKHSVATLKAWAAYNKKLLAEGKPLPKAPKMSRAQTLARFNTACAPLETIADESTVMIEPDEETVPDLNITPAIEFAAEEETAPALVAENATDPATPSSYPTLLASFGGGLPGTPGTPGGPTPPPIAPTPEPSTWMLLGTGLVGILKLATKKVRA